MNHYVLFTEQNCNPCNVVKTMLSQAPLKEGITLEIVSATEDPRVVDFVVRTVPTLANVGTKELTTGTFNIVKELTR